MKTTERVVIGTTLGLLAWEGFTFINREKKDTISEIIWKWNKRTPLVAFAIGLLCGHWFWQKAEKDTNG
jgi:hypothetical protein